MIVRPNDGLCHLNDENGKYTEAEVQDYPSLGQIGRLVKDYAINLIFAVTQDVAPVYSAFGDMIEGASVGKLDSDSENIVELIRSTYQVKSFIPLHCFYFILFKFTFSRQYLLPLS